MEGIGYAIHQHIDSVVNGWRLGVVVVLFFLHGDGAQTHTCTYLHDWCFFHLSPKLEQVEFRELLRSQLFLLLVLVLAGTITATKSVA